MLVMELCELGSLHRVARGQPGLGRREIVEVLRQTAEGLAFLHGQQVTHRDLKPLNILVRSRRPLSVALTDFGLAKRKTAELLSRCGTDPYLAPEMTDDGGPGAPGYYSKAVDVWALGVTGLELLLLLGGGGGGGLPAMTSRAGDYPRRIFDSVSRAWEANPRDMVVAIVRKMLAWDWQDRPEAEECVEDAARLLQLQMEGRFDGEGFEFSFCSSALCAGAGGASQRTAYRNAPRLSSIWPLSNARDTASTVRGKRRTTEDREETSAGEQFPCKKGFRASWHVAAASEPARKMMPTEQEAEDAAMLLLSLRNTRLVDRLETR